jgi:hypothetical protein
MNKLSYQRVYTTLIRMIWKILFEPALFFFIYFYQIQHVLSNAGVSIFQGKITEVDTWKIVSITI